MKNHGAFIIFFIVLFLFGGLLVFLEVNESRTNQKLHDDIEECIDHHGVPVVVEHHVEACVPLP